MTISILFSAALMFISVLCSFNLARKHKGHIDEFGDCDEATIFDWIGVGFIFSIGLLIFLANVFVGS